uniref:Uncharacterized protein n=1 Tax=Panagrolaimus sp. ES5 TaxID=591445 RepID=A0AC34FJ10_9BILA
MPCLNQEVLFDIGKQLIEDGDSDAVIRFALSGKEPFQAMSKVFASVTTLGLFSNCFSIGWKDKCYAFRIRNNKPSFIWLLSSIGNSVTRLHINYGNIPSYRPIIEKIVAKKQLISFSAGNCCYQTFLDNFIPQISSTLKTFAIPSGRISSIIRDTVDLESVKVFKFGNKFALNHCQSSISIDNPYILIRGRNPPSPYLSSMKYLTFNFFSIDDLMKYFPSIEFSECKVPEPNECFSFLTEFEMMKNIGSTIHLINKTNKALSKKLRSLYPTEDRWEAAKSLRQPIYHDFEYDDSNPNKFYFQKIIPSAGSQSTMFEIQIFK